MTLRARLAAGGAAAAIVLGSPLVGQLRQELLRAFPRYYVAILSALVVLGGVAVFAFCIRRIRQDRARRFGALALSALLALASFARLRSGNPNVDAVEAFHFVEYSALTVLFFPFAQPGARGDAYVRAGLAATVVAIADEWFQWFVPGRAGELHDVLVDLVATACGLLLCLALDLRDAGSPGPAIRGRARRLGLLGALAVVLLGAFTATVQLGHEIHDPEIGTFRSRFTAPRLLELGENRRRKWAGGPPPAVGRWGREDQYLAEALWHVRRRNFGMDKDRKGDTAELDIAWNENRILETYFRPVLQAPPAPGTTGHRLAPEQIAAVDVARAHGSAPFVSDAEAAPLYVWPPALFWVLVAAAAGATCLAGRLVDGVRAGRMAVHLRGNEHA